MKMVYAMLEDFDGMKPEEIDEALRESGKRMFGESFEPVSTSMEDSLSKKPAVHDKTALHKEPSQTLYATLKDRLRNFFKSDQSDLETTVNEPGTAINAAGSGLFRRLFTAAMLVPLAYLATEVGANYVQHKEPVKTVWAGDTSAAAVNLDAYLVQIESNFVDAGKRINIDDYYRRSVPRDDIASGARMGKYKIGINGRFHGIFKKTLDLYLSDTSNGKGKELKDSFSKYKLDGIFRYINDNSEQFTFIGFHNEGYLELFTKNKQYKIMMPIPSGFATELVDKGLSKY
jgi:hypothetical protein